MSEPRSTRPSFNIALIAIALSLMVLFVMWSPASAGEIEYDVINGAYTDFVNIDWTAEGADLLIEAAAVDMLEIWDDTDAGSYCEQVAATSYAMMSIAYDLVLDLESKERYVVFMGAVVPLLDEIGAMGTRCLNER